MAARAGCRQPPSGSLRPRGPLFPAGRRRLSAPSERGPRGGQRGPHRLAPPTSQLQPGPPQLPVPPSLPGPKKRPCFAFRERGEGLTRPWLPGAFTRAPRHCEGTRARLPRSPRGRRKRCKLPGERALGAPGPGLRRPPGPGLTSLKGADEVPAPVGWGLRDGAPPRADTPGTSPAGIGAVWPRSRP